MKWPGAQRRFEINGHGLVIAKRGLSDGQLDLYAEEAGFGLPAAPAAPRVWLVVLVVLVALLVLGLVIAIAGTLVSGGAVMPTPKSP